MQQTAEEDVTEADAGRHFRAEAVTTGKAHFRRQQSLDDAPKQFIRFGRSSDR